MTDNSSPPLCKRPVRLGLARLIGIVVLGFACLAGVGSWFVWNRWHVAQVVEFAAEFVDPRTSFPTPYRNVRPDVLYVGDRACADCHPTHVNVYQHHPMGNALAPLSTALPIERFDRGAHNPFQAGRFEYEVIRQGPRWLHQELVRDAQGQAVERGTALVRFAIGSGARARSYAIERGDYLFQSPITWFPQPGRWDLSPSYELRNQHLGRPITPGCLFCHSNFAEHVPHTINRYREPIFRGFAVGCERCHGPGELHVRRRGDGGEVAGLDDTIVNPARLDHGLREAVCQQCHLQGEQRVVAKGLSDFDFRPGLPLPLFLMDFVDGGGKSADFKFVNSVEQMLGSRCYNASREPNKLGCTSCHDPHRHPTRENRVAHYRQRCLRCHTESSCSLPAGARRTRQPEDSCIACHMPRNGSEVNHTSITDHGVPRQAPSGGRPAPPRRPTPGPGELVPFDRDLPGLKQDEVARNHGLACMAMLSIGLPDPVARQFAAAALPELENALARDPNDHAAREARADALWCLGQREAAMSDYEAVLQAWPEAETALQGAGNASLGLNRPEAARVFFERAAKVNPWRWHYPHGLAVASYRRGEWRRAVDECRQGLGLEPANASTRSLLIQCHLRLGEKELAEREFQTLLALTTEGRRASLRAWYKEEQTRLGS